MIYLTAGGCAGINLDDRAPPQATTPQAATPPQPEGEKLAELVSAAFAKAKLTGAPEVSPVHATHDNQWGDWVFCVKSGSPDQPMKYAVLIGHGDILEVRSSVLIDGCDQETYRPLAPAGQNAKAGGRK